MIFRQMTGVTRFVEMMSQYIFIILVTEISIDINKCNSILMAQLEDDICIAMKAGCTQEQFAFRVS